MSDALLETVQKIIAQAKADSVPIYYGFSPDQHQDVFHWDQEQGGDWEVFLACARTANASLVYLTWMVFDREHLEDVKSNEGKGIEEDGDGEGGPDLSEYEQYVGKVGSFDLMFVVNGLRHVYTEVADWCTDFWALTEPDEDESGRDDESVDGALVEDWARRLAGDPAYGRCKNYGAKQYLLKKLAGDETSELPVRHILEQAEVIWEVEAGPREEQRLRNEVRELKAEGLTIAAIAQRLSISRYRVSGLIDS